MRYSCGVIVVASLSACAEGSVSDISSAIDTQSENSAIWMLGTWDCTAGYFEVPPFFRAHPATGVYTFEEDVSAQGTVHGEYIETLGPRFGEFEPNHFGEIWTIGDPSGSLGQATATQDVVMADGSMIVGEGTSRGGGTTPGLLGVTSLRGRILFPNQETRDWRGGAIAFDKPDRFTENRSIAVAQGVFQVYSALSCRRRS